MLLAPATIDDFKASTITKLSHVQCPMHGEHPRISFAGTSLRDVTLSVRSCCAQLSSLANRALAGDPDSGSQTHAESLTK